MAETRTNFFKRIGQSSILAHFIAAMALLLLIVILVIAFASNIFISRILAEELENGQRTFLAEIKQTLNAKFKLIEKSLQIFANDYRVQNFQDSESQIGDRDMMLFFDEIIDFHRYNKFEWSPLGFKGNFVDEIIFFNSREDLFRRKTFFMEFNSGDKAAFKKLPVFRELTENDLHWSPVYYNTVEGTHIPVESQFINPVTRLFLYQITCARNVTHRKSGASLGIIAVNIKLYHIVELIQGIRKLTDERIFLLDQEQKVIAASDGFIPLKTIEFDTGTLESYHSMEAGMPFQGNVGGEESLLMKLPCEFNNWTLLSVLPQHLLFRHVFSIQLIIYLVGLASFVIALFLSIRITKSIIKPLRDIILFMDNHALKGNHSKISLKNKPKEILSLGKSLNQMLVRIQELNEAIEQEHRMKRIMELKALRLQINPHFIYNSLDSIRWLARAKSRKNEVEELIRNLTDFFRLGLSKGRLKISIADEIQHVECYLKVQKLRYDKRLQYLIDCDERARELLTIKIILQPLVENAIYHGIREKKEGGFIRISVERFPAEVRFTVIDNGLGMSENKQQLLNTYLASWKDDSSSAETGFGIGMFNIHSRLKLYYGDNYGLSFKSEEGKGSKVIVKIPIESDEAK